MVTVARGARSNLLAALCVAAATSVGCSAFEDRAPGAKLAFQVPCVFPRNPLEFDRIGAPCLLPPPGQVPVVDAPCEITHSSHAAMRLHYLYEYDEQGRIIAEETRHVGRLEQSYRYAYEQSGDVLAIKRGSWNCDSETTDFTETWWYRKDARGVLTSVETQGGTINLGYEDDLLGLRTQVMISDGDNMYSFKLNRKGEIVSRNQAGHKDFPTSLDYEHEGGHVVEILERAKNSARLNEYALDYEGGRLTEMVKTTYSSTGYAVEKVRFNYQCSEFPTCMQRGGLMPSAAAPGGQGGKPSEKMPANVDVKSRNADGVKWARDVQQRVDGVRRGAGKPLVRWDEALFDVAQREADQRSRGITAFDPLSLHMLGYRVAVRVEKLGLGASAALENDVHQFSMAEVWDAMGNRAVGVGVARVGDGQPDAGKLALVVVSAQKER